MADVFISHQHEDRALASALDKVLRDAGCTVWWDTSLTAGDSWDEKIRKELDAAECVVVLWSHAAWASKWVQAEALDGHRREILVMGLFEDVALKVPFNTIQAADLRGWRGQRDHPGVNEIVRGVETKLGRKASALDGEQPVPVGQALAPSPRRVEFSPHQAPKEVAPPPRAPQRRTTILIASAATVGVLAAAFCSSQRQPPAAPPETDPPAAARVGQPTTTPTPTEAGAEFKDCDGAACPTMVVIPAGSFRMGSPESETGSLANEGPQHWVTLASFAASRYDVTFEQYDACTADGACPKADDNQWGRTNRPVINVSWNDAQKYVKWLSGKTRKTYRLLSEAEWEYAARAGAATAYYWGDGKGASGNANCNGCGSPWDNKETSPVGSFQPNAFGLFDMAGNVWQWTEDCYTNSYSDAPSDGAAQTRGGCSLRILRGGSWSADAQYLRSAYRDWDSPSFRGSGSGFRVARTLSPA